MKVQLQHKWKALNVMLTDFEEKRIEGFFSKRPGIKKGSFFSQAISEKIAREEAAEAEARR